MFSAKEKQILLFGGKTQFVVSAGSVSKVHEMTTLISPTLVAVRCSVDELPFEFRGIAAVYQRASTLNPCTLIAAYHIVLQKAATGLVDQKRIFPTLTMMSCSVELIPF